MIVSDTVMADHDEWLAEILKERADEVERLFLVYNDHKFGPDTAHEIWDKVAGEDFVARGESNIVSNEEIRNSVQRGMVHVAPPVPEGSSHHWWLEIFIDKDLDEVLE